MSYIGSKINKRRPNNVRNRQFGTSFPFVQQIFR
jgi:hypothetical protein